MEGWGTDLVQHLLEIGYIAAFTWLTIGLLEIAHAFIVARLPRTSGTTFAGAASGPRSSCCARS